VRMAGVGGKRPAGWALALPIAKRAKRAKRPDQAAWDAALIDHRADAEIGWVTFQACGRSPAAAAAVAGTRARRVPAMTTVPPCVRRSLDVKWRTLLKPLSQGGAGHLPVWAAERGQSGSARPPGGVCNAHAAACTGGAPAARGGALGGRACLLAFRASAGAAAAAAPAQSASIGRRGWPALAVC